MRIIIGIFSFLATFFTGVIFSDNNNIQVKEYKIRHKRIKKPARFVFISDLHGRSFGPDNERLLEKIEESKPDFVVIGGDLITTKFTYNYGVMEQVVKRLSEKYKVYYAMGNHESRLKWKVTCGGRRPSISYEELIRRIEAAGAEVLDNKSATLSYYGIKFTGLSLDKTFYNKKHKFTLSEKNIEECIDATDDGSYNILLAHNPEYYNEYCKLPYNLVLSGHMHGGVMRLPKGMGFIDPRFRLFKILCWGTARKEDTRIIVSRGLSMHTIPIRVFNPAELTVVTLKGESKRPDKLIKRIMKRGK